MRIVSLNLLMKISKVRAQKYLSNIFSGSKFKSFRLTFWLITCLVCDPPLLQVYNDNSSVFTSSSREWCPQWQQQWQQHRHHRLQQRRGLQQQHVLCSQPHDRGLKQTSICVKKKPERRAREKIQVKEIKRFICVLEQLLISSAGGLVTAVAPVVVECNGLWVGWTGLEVSIRSQIYQICIISRISGLQCRHRHHSRVQPRWPQSHGGP